MKLTKVHLFVLLLLALVLCSFVGGNCMSLEGFDMQSNSNPYSGTGEKYSNYRDYYKTIDKEHKEQDKTYDRKDKPLPPSNNHSSDDVSKYAPYESSSSFLSSKHKNEQGIRASQILPGQEDLYVLKSSIVPPVCPSCPSVKCDGGGGGGGVGGEKKCPPCPPCARCPEPAFECKKVPNYISGNDEILPRPVLNSFSQFGL